MKRIIVIAVAIACSAQASEEGKLTVAAGAEYLSNLSKRGATFYDSYQAFPIFAIQLWSPNLLIVNSTLHYKLDITDHLRYRSILNVNATGDEPLYETGPEVDKAALRDTTHEWDHVLEFRRDRVGELSLTWSKDLKAHHGFHVELGARVVLWNQPLGKLTFQPALTAAYGVGSVAHNRYLYGAGVSSETTPTHTRVGFSISAPPNIDPYFPVIQVTHYRLTGKNRDGQRVGDKTEGLQVLALFAVRLVNGL